MRDMVVLRELDEIRRNVSKDVTALHDLNIMTKTRMEAFEILLFGDRFSILKLIWMQFWDPQWVWQKVDEKHGELLQDYRNITQSAEKKINSVTVLK